MSTEPGSRTAPSPSAATDAWAEQARIGGRLAAWSLVSIAGGAAAARAGQVRGSRALRAFGGQNAGWGAVDLAIAGFGEMRRRSRMATLADPQDRQVQERELRSLRRILLVNAGLDVGYIAAGLGGLAWSLRRAGRPTLAGHSAAVVVQGGFLLAFDTLHARAVGQVSPSSSH